MNFDDCQLEVVSDVISGMVDQDAGVDVCANFDDSKLKPSGLEASFSVDIRCDCRPDGCEGFCKIW